MNQEYVVEYFCCVWVIKCKCENSYLKYLIMDKIITFSKGTLAAYQRKKEVYDKHNTVSKKSIRKNERDRIIERNASPT